MTIPFDFHTHTAFSFDGDSTAEEMVLKAIELGMKNYAITDHVEANLFYDKEYGASESIAKAAEIIPALREKYADRISVSYGIELGQPVHDLSLSENILGKYDFDFVIGSCHNIRGYEDFYFLNYNELDYNFLLDVYFEELLEMSEWGGFDVLGHLTYPLRYICGEYGKEVDMSAYDGIIDEIFRALIKNGCGIEINTSGLRQKIGETMPPIKYIRRYRELGGKLLTIGSDAHRTDDLGKGIAEGIALAKEAGFSEIAVYKKRKPIMININL